MDLPDLPVDDVALDLYWQAIHPGEDAERSSLGDLLDFMSEMGGSDTQATESVHYEGDTPFVVYAEPRYHPNQLISALITEIRRLRGASEAEGPTDGG